MATYYISPSGSDSNTGLSPDASGGANGPWLTVGKAVNTGSTVVPGDIIYIAPGYYYSANCAPIVGIASAASPTHFNGDPLNVQGFKDGSGVRLAAGLVWVTTRTAVQGLDGLASVTTSLFDLATSGVDGLQFRNMVLEAWLATNGVFSASPTTNADILVEDCRLIGTIAWNWGNTAATAARNLIMRRNIWFGSTFIASTNSQAAATADADLNCLFESNLIFGRMTGTLTLAASGGNLAGGLTFRGNTCLALLSGTAILTTALRISTVTPIHVAGNLIIGSIGLNAGTAGHIISDGYNRFFCTSANTNVTDGTGDVRGAALNIVLPDLVKWGLEMPRADIFGWTDAAVAAQKDSAWAPTTAGFWGRTVRPWGAGASIGYTETPTVAQDATSAITGGGVNSLKLTGAGEISLYVPIDATGTTISVRTKSTTYGGASYPQLIVMPNPSIGVPTAVTVTAAAATEETLTTATITPTAKGVLEVRLVSRSTTVTSSTYFDVLA